MIRVNQTGRPWWRSERARGIHIKREREHCPPHSPIIFRLLTQTWKIDRAAMTLTVYDLASHYDFCRRTRFRLIMLANKR